MPCPKPQTHLGWASHIRAIMEMEDLQGSSQGNLVVWRSWCWGSGGTNITVPTAVTQTIPPAPGLDSLGQIRTWHHQQFGLQGMISLSSGISSLWTGRDPALRVRQQEGWPKFSLLDSLSQRGEQAASRTKSHQQGQGHTGADWAPGMPLWDYQRETLLCEVGSYLLTPKAQTCHPQAFLSCSPHLSPISLNPAILSLFSQVKITFGCLISLLQTDFSFKGRYILNVCVWQVWPHFLWHLCWQHIATTDTHNCSWASPRTLQPGETKLCFLLYEDFHCDLSTKYKLWAQWILCSQNVWVSQYRCKKVGKKPQFQSKIEMEITTEYF